MGADSGLLFPPGMDWGGEMKKMLVVLLLAVLSVGVMAGGYRSAKAKHDFKSAQPCPATGKSRGACPGWVIDHVIPLACGGADAPSNMQWQTLEDAKAKDKWERKSCQRRR